MKFKHGKIDMEDIRIKAERRAAELKALELKHAEADLATYKRELVRFHGFTPEQVKARLNALRSA